MVGTISGRGGNMRADFKMTCSRSCSYLGPQHKPDKKLMKNEWMNERKKSSSIEDSTNKCGRRDKNKESPFGSHHNNNWFRQKLTMYAITRVKHLVYNRLIHSLKVSPRRYLYKGEYYNLIVEKSGRQLLNKMIKIITVNGISNGRNWHFLPLDVRHWEKCISSVIVLSKKA